MGRVEEAAALEATYLLVQRWLEGMEEDRSDTNDLNGEHMPQSGISPPCLPSDLDDRNGKKLSTLSNHPLIERLLLFTCSDLTVENTHIDATRPNQSAGVVPKVHPLSDNLHLDSQSIDSPASHFLESSGNKLGQSLPSTLNAIDPPAMQDPQSSVSGTWDIHRAPAFPEVGLSIRKDNSLALGQAADPGVTAPLAEHIQSNSTHLSTQPSRGQRSVLSPGGGFGSCRIAIADNIERAQMDHDLQRIVRTINASAWLRDNDPEVRIGHPDCPVEAEQYGARGQSVYTAFVDFQNDYTYGCKDEACRTYSTRSLEEAVRHQRYHHFNHLPYACVPASGAMWYVSSYPVRWSNPS